MLWGVVKLHASQQLCGCALAEYVNETLAEVDVQVVEHEMNALGGRVSASEQRGNEVDEVVLAAVVRDRDLAMSAPVSVVIQ